MKMIRNNVTPVLGPFSPVNRRSNDHDDKRTAVPNGIKLDRNATSEKCRLFLFERDNPDDFNRISRRREQPAVSHKKHRLRRPLSFSRRCPSQGARRRSWVSVVFVTVSAACRRFARNAACSTTRRRNLVMLSFRAWTRCRRSSSIRYRLVRSRKVQTTIVRRRNAPHTSDSSP